MDPLELLLIRHGQSQFNLNSSGGLNSPLTDLGREQARKLAPWVAQNFRPSVFYASPMQRARETAEIIQPALGMPIQFREDLCEVDFEIGPVMPQFAHPTDAIGGDIFSVSDLDERYAAFQARVVAAFHDILRKHDSGTILVVSHGGIIATMLRTIFGAHQTSVHEDNTSATLLRWENSRWYLVYSNRTDHLR